MLEAGGASRFLASSTQQRQIKHITFELDEEIYIKQTIERSILKLQSAMKQSYNQKQFEMLRIGCKKEKIFIKKVLIITESSYFLATCHYVKTDETLILKGKKTPRGQQAQGEMALINFTVKIRQSLRLYQKVQEEQLQVLKRGTFIEIRNFLKPYADIEFRRCITKQMQDEAYERMNKERKVFLQSGSCIANIQRMWRKK